MTDDELFSRWIAMQTKNLMLGPSKMALFIALHRNIWNKSPEQRAAVREMFEGNLGCWDTEPRPHWLRAALTPSAHDAGGTDEH